MNQYDQQFALSGGMDVMSSEGDKVGEVADVFSNHFVVQKGFFFPETYYIPSSAITSVADGRVYLNVSKEEAMNQDPSWNQRPDDASTVGAAGAFGDDRAGDGLKRDPQPFEHEQDSQRTHVNEEDDLRVDVSEEELVADKRRVDRGSVNIDKTVVAEEQEIDVPVTEERVEVTRHAVDRDVAPGEDAFSEGTVEVPVHGEEVEVEKRARVVEEIDVDKEAVQDTERVSGTVRHEEVTVDGDPVERSTSESNKAGRRNSKR